MSKKSAIPIFILFTLFTLFMFASVSYAAIPQMIGYEGRLTHNTDGSPVIDTTAFTFQMFSTADVSESGIVTQTLTPDANGVFSTVIPFPPVVFDGTPRSMEVTVNGETMVPRIPVASAAHAYRALYADDSASLEGYSVSSTGGVTHPNVIPATNGYGTLDISFIPAGTGGSSWWATSEALGHSNDVYNLNTGGNVGIGTNSPDQQLEITQNLRMPGTTNAARYGIIYKGSNPFIHDFNYGNNGSVTTFGLNTFVGVNAGNFTMGSTATAAYQSSHNTGIGYYALNANTTGADNAAVGYLALQPNTSGSYNAALGSTALRSNTGGSQNVAVGFGALYSNTSGTNNAAIGFDALYANTTGGGNFAMGQGALNNCNGANNCALGSNTGSSITSGSDNTFLGYSAGSNPSQKVDAVNSTAVGANAYTTASDQMVYGDNNITRHVFTSGQLMISGGSPATGEVLTAVDSTGLATWEPGGGGPWSTGAGNVVYYNNGNVGIGTSEPTSKLTVSGTVDANDYLKNGAPLGTNVGLGWASNEAGDIYNTNPSGKVGIGTTEPTAKLSIATYDTNSSSWLQPSPGNYCKTHGPFRLGGQGQLPRIEVNPGRKECSPVFA